jgi:acetoin utilization protein AcuB
MIVSEVMTTKLVTVTPEDTLSHAANLLRQHQFHHLPVVRILHTHKTGDAEHAPQTPVLLLEGLLTSQDIDLAATLGSRSSSSELLRRPWQEQYVSEFMHRATIRVTPNISVAAAAQLLVERGLNCLPVVEYENVAEETQPLLVGLLTRSDLLLALARSMGAFEPGMEVTITLPAGDMAPLAQTLLLATELHVQIRSVIAAPLQTNTPQVATVRLGTINPTPLLIRLQEAGIAYTFAGPEDGGDTHG